MRPAMLHGAANWNRCVTGLAGLVLALVASLAVACGSDDQDSSTGGGTNSGGAASGGTGANHPGSGGSGAGSQVPGDGGQGGNATGGSTGVACKVGEEIYPDGSTDVPDPMSCNTCHCLGGQLGQCTEIGCPSSCPRDHEYGVQCAQCGPADACEVVEHGCFPVCDVDGDCRDGGSCLDGVCLRVCG